MNKEQLLIDNNLKTQLNKTTGDWLEWHGFRLARSKWGEGTIIQYKAADASIKRMIVKDAKFRDILSCLKAGAS